MRVVTTRPARRPELGEYLRARRDRITPAQAGIAAFPGPRRVPGLRREELAMLAGVSTDYLSRVEQGRQAHVSVAVLDALARALRLDEIEHAHLRDLAAPATRPGHGPGPGGARQRPDPGLLRLMTALDHLPVLLLGYRGDVLAQNALLETVLGRPFGEGTSFTRFLFQDPLARQRIINWEMFAAASVAALRREVGRRPYDTALRRLIDDLRADPQVDAWWHDHRVVDYSSLVKNIDHPVAGQLRFEVETVSAPLDPEQRLVVYTAEPDSPTARALPLLASYGTDTGPGPGADVSMGSGASNRAVTTD
jgi:transcriptional regulator with XRE-family HTH domain